MPDPTSSDPASPRSAGRGASGAPAFVVACVLGAVALVLVAAGLASGSKVLSVIGAFVATAAVIAVLVWRSQLIAAFAPEKARLRAQAPRRRR